MKWLRFFVLLGVACLMVGCQDTSTGTAGDANDPAAAGDDEAQMNEEEVETATGEE